MPKSSRHKSHKQSKHSTRDYSDSDDDVMKLKEKSSKEDNSGRGHRDIASGEKRKSSSHFREGKDGKDLGGHGNGEVIEEYANSKRRKEKTDDVGRDRWSGGVDERGGSDKNVDKERHEGESLKFSNKSDTLRIDSKNRSKRDESGVSSERKEDNLASIVVSKEGSKSKEESKRKSERDSSLRKDGKEMKEHRSHKEKNGGHDSKSEDIEVKSVDKDVGKKQGAARSGDLSEERQGKRPRESADRALQDDLQNLDLEKEVEKKIRRKREDSGERERHYTDSKVGDEKRSSSRGDRAKDGKYKDDRHKDGDYADKHKEDGNKEGRRRDEKYSEADKDNKHREDSGKDDKRRGDRHLEDGDRDGRRRDEKYREDGDRDRTQKDDKYREDNERESRRDDRYYDDGDKDSRRKDSRYHEDGDKDVRRGSERHQEDGDERRRETSYRDENSRDNWHKEDKNRKDTERDTRHKEDKRDKRQRESKYRDELSSKDRSRDKSDPKYSRDDDYATDHHIRKSTAYDDSPTYDDRSTRYRDDQGRRKNYEKDDYGDIRLQSNKDQRSDPEKKSVSSARMDSVSDRVRSTSRTVDADYSSSHSRRRSSPTSSSLQRDNNRALKQDESKYKDYNYDGRVRHNVTSSRDGANAAIGVSDRTSSRSLEKLGQKGDDHSRELSAERHLNSGTRSSALEPMDKSPFNRTDVRRSIDAEEPTQRSGGSRDWREHSGKEGGRGSRELGMDLLPGEEFSQADPDNSSVSSPFMRNNHSKSLLPPPFRAGADNNPSLLGSGEDDGRGKSNIRHRRIGDPNMGRVQGNSWRGIPSWPSPVANGFMPFAPPVNFHSVMHPFPGPPMFGVRPGMELDHTAPYHMSDANRFSGPGRPPMGWPHHHMDNSVPPMHAWDANNTVYGDESYMYGRSDWDGSKNLPGGQGRETGEDLWRGPNRTGSMEMPSSDKENGSTRSGDETLSGQSMHPTQNEKTRTGEHGESTDLGHLTKGFEKDEVKLPRDSLEGSSDASKMSKKDDINIFQFYLSKLDISADLIEPELFTKYTSLIDTSQSISFDDGDSKILYLGDNGPKMVSERPISHILFASTDDSVFQKSMSLYKKQKESSLAKEGENLKILSDLVPSDNKEDETMEDAETGKTCPKDDFQNEQDSLPQFDIELDSENVSQQKIDTVEIPEDPVPGMDSEDNPVPVESKEISDSPPSPVKDATVMESTYNKEEVKLLDSESGPLLNSDVSPPEAFESMMPESVLSESVNLSRIHHSPESTH